jgi:hypothetical protein
MGRGSGGEFVRTSLAGRLNKKRSRYGKEKEVGSENRAELKLDEHQLLAAAVYVKRRRALLKGNYRSHLI